MIRIFGPLVSPSTSAVTLAPVTSVLTVSPSTRRSGCRLTLEPTSSLVRSISRRSPTATLCWRPPLRTIAYTPDLLSSLSWVAVRCVRIARFGSDRNDRTETGHGRAHTEDQGYAAAPGRSNPERSNSGDPPPEVRLACPPCCR